MNRLNSFLQTSFLCLFLTSCTLQSHKGSFGLLSTKDLAENQRLSSQEKSMIDKQCLTLVLGIIPVGDFSFMKVTNRVNHMIDQSEALALANVEMVQSLSVFIPFYVKACHEIQGTPMVPYQP